MKRSYFLFILIIILTNTSWAQELICCGLLVSVKGNWIGADRRCTEYLEEHPEKRELACKRFLKDKNVCEALKPYCKLCSGKDGDNAYLPDDPIVQDIIKGFHAQGVMIGPEHILVQPSKSGGYDKFVVRLDKNGCVLPDGQCVMEAGSNGYLPEGKQEGAFRHLYGSVLKAGTRTRVKVRTVNIETGEIMSTGKGDAGPGDKGITDATSNALGNMGMACKEARGLVLR